MIGTVLKATVNNGSVVTFEEGELLNATWTPSLWMEIDDSILALPLTAITVKTTTGFTLANLLQECDVFGIVSDGSQAPGVDPGLEAYAIVTLTDIKSYLKRATDNTVDDAFFLNSINRVSGIIEDAVKGKVKQQSITGLIVDGNGEDTLTLPKQYVPVSQIGIGASPAASDIQYRSTPTSSWADLLTNIGNAVISNVTQDSNWIYIYTGYFPEGIQNIKLNLKAGYATIPPVFVQVCIEMVASIYYESKRGGSRLALSSSSASQESRNENLSFTTLSERHRMLLQPYTFAGYSTTSVSLYR